MLAFIELSYKSLFKQRTRTVLIIIQLFIGIVSLSIGLGMIEGSERYIKNIESLASTDTFRLGSFVENTTHITSEGLQRYYNSIQNDNRVLHIGSYLTTSIQVKNNDKITAVFVDKPFLNMFNFKIFKGKNISQNDYDISNNQYIPVLIGYNLSNKYPIGSIIESGIPDDRKMKIVPKKFIVVGILCKKFIFWKGQSTDLSDCIINDDNVIVAPIQDEQNYGEQLKTRINTNTLIKLKKPEKSMEFIKFVQYEMSKYGLKGNVSSIDTQIKVLLKQNQIPMIFTLIFAILILILSSFGLMGVILASIVRRKYEFGIRYALGATPRNLVLLIVMEIMGLYFIASILGTLFSSIMSSLLPRDVLIELGLRTVLCTFFVTSILSLMSAIIPINKISKIEPVNLIGGKTK